MDYDTAVTRTATQLAIFIFGFTSGVVMFTAVAIALGPLPGVQGGQDLDVLRWVALAFPLVELPMALQLWAITTRRMRELDDWQARLGALRGRVIVVAAMFEAAALLSGVTILLTGFNWQSLPALALFLAAMAALVPTRRRVVAAIGREDGGKPDEYS